MKGIIMPQLGSIKIVCGKPEGIKDSSVIMPISAESTDTNSLIVFQKILERNPDFNPDPTLYKGKIVSPRDGVYAFPFPVLISTGEGKQERDLEVFERMVGTLITGLKAEGIHSYQVSV